MNQIKQKTKQNKKSDVVVAVAVLGAIATMIFTIGTPYMTSIQDIQAKNGHALDLPIKTEECKHEVVNGPSCKDSENAPDNPGLCQEGWIPATPPLNPQLGCLPGSITADLGPQPDEDEREATQSDDESISGEDEDRNSMLPAGSADGESSKYEDEDNEGEEEEDGGDNEDGTGRDSTRGEEQ